MHACAHGRVHACMHDNSPHAHLPQALPLHFLSMLNVALLLYSLQIFLGHALLHVMYMCIYDVLGVYTRLCVAEYVFFVYVCVCVCMYVCMYVCTYVRMRMAVVFPLAHACLDTRIHVLIRSNPTDWTN